MQLTIPAFQFSTLFELY
uniref:Uncharacterized protein n=1 Tax=Arundo donax TaxID=35708 RepID=A0A0A8Z8N0_ARUDO